MAILENETNNYFKINFDKCAVKGRLVYVNFSVYKTEIDRQKEKDRESKISKFFLDLRQYLDGKYRALVTAIGDLTLEEILSKTDIGKIDSAKYPKLSELQYEANELLPYERLIANAIYQYGEENSVIQIDKAHLPKLQALGFEEEWTASPVRISSGAEVFCGEYNDEHIDMPFYYNRLKTVMSNNILDC